MDKNWILPIAKRQTRLGKPNNYNGPAIRMERIAGWSGKGKTLVSVFLKDVVRELD
jgi:hypothetical protein